MRCDPRSGLFLRLRSGRHVLWWRRPMTPRAMRPRVLTTPAYTKYTTISREPGYRVWGMLETNIHAKRQPRTIFSMHRSSIRNQHPRNTCKHQRNPSAFPMKPRVYKPQKNGRQSEFKWRLVFSSLFSEVKSHKTQVIFGVPA